MDSQEFKKWRKKLNKTQKEIAELLGISVKSAQGYEQGWRNIPTHVERLMYFHLSRRDGNPKRRKPRGGIYQRNQRRSQSCHQGGFAS